MSRSKTIKKSCVYCSKEYFPWSVKHAVYCSIQCQADANFDKRYAAVVSNNNWRSGWKNVGTLKTAFIKVNGAVCSICGNIEWMGRNIPLVLDHINGNSEDWSNENLRLVCGNCDMQLPTYKGKNKGNGRHYRKQRYREGKSF